MKTKENGITLVVLVITIILLLILASVGVTVGTSTLDTAAFIQFKSELKIMQNKVNELNQENKTDIGQELTDEQKNVLDITAISDIIFNGKNDEEKTKIQNGFRYFSKDYINTELNLDSVKRNYLVNIEYRYVIFPDGFEYKGITYYMIDQIEGEIYNVRYNDKNEKSGSFEVNTTKEDNKWKVEISNIQYNGYVSKWQVKYKLEGASYWETSNDLTFYLRDEGTYTIKVVHGDEIDLGTQEVSIIDKEKTFYFEVPDSWIGNTVYCWMWGTDDDGNIVNNATEYPGTAMTKVDESSNVYSYTLSTEDPNYELYTGVSFCTEELTKVPSTSNSYIRTNSTVDIKFSTQNINQIFKVEPYSDPSNSNNIRVFFISYLDGTSSTSDRNAYVWNSSTEKASWPGEAMTKCSLNVYSYIVDRSQYQNIIFNISRGTVQTSDLTVPTEQDQTFLGYGSSKVSTDSDWGKYVSDGKWYDYK